MGSGAVAWGQGSGKLGPSRFLSRKESRRGLPGLADQDQVGQEHLGTNPPTEPLGVAAAALINSAGGNAGFAAGLTAATFATLALIAILWGVAHIAVGNPLRRRRRWSRHAALMLGGVDLLLLPYGTALGVYALWVLLRDDAKRLFEAE